MKIKNNLLSLLCCLLAFCLSGAMPAAALDAQTALEQAVEYRLESSGTESIGQYFNDVLAPAMGEGGELELLALTQREEQPDCTACAEALLKYLSSHHTTSASTRQKYALTLLAAGCRSDYIARTMSDSAGKLGIMSWIYALHLVNNGVPCEEYTAEDIITQLLDLQLEDGGWAIYGSAADVDVTAMTLQSLAPYFGTDDRVTASVQRALGLLSERQLPEGGFSSFGEANAESSAQVIIALCALGIDPAADPRFAAEGGTVVDALLTCRTTEGGFAHTPHGEYSPSADRQALCALVAMERLHSGKGSLYVLDPREDCTPEGVVYVPFVPQGVEDAPEAPSGARLWVCAGAVLAGGAVCALLFLRGKGSGKNLLVTAAGVLAVILLALTLDIQTPSEYYGTVQQKPSPSGQITLSVTCEVIAGEQAAHIPQDGVILDTCTMDIADGETVLDLLLQAAQAEGFTVGREGGYIRSIAGIREHDFGQLSGWVYRVNSEIPSQGCDSFELQAGDRVEWLYSLELGREFENSQ